MVNFSIELIVRGLVLCLLTAIMLILFRRTAAAYRHILCVLALCGLLILPLAQQFLPPLRLLPARNDSKSPTTRQHQSRRLENVLCDCGAGTSGHLISRSDEENVQIVGGRSDIGSRQVCGDRYLTQITDSEQKRP